MAKEKLPLRPGVITLIVWFSEPGSPVPHPGNFAPVGAMTLSGASYCSGRYPAFPKKQLFTKYF